MAFASLPLLQSKNKEMKLSEPRALVMKKLFNFRPLVNSAVHQASLFPLLIFSYISTITNTQFSNQNIIRGTEL